MSAQRPDDNDDRGPVPDIDELLRVFCGMRHARYHDPTIVYHVVLRTVQGRFLLRPDDAGVLASLTNGVLARAQELFPSVELFADAWLSNHGHLLLRGDPFELPAFIGFVEREISRRWGALIGWDGNMFQRYVSTALPTPESQEKALRYVLSQSTKEHLVTSPLKWPGVHCAKDLVRGFTRRGIWFDGTSYGKALHRNRARVRRRSPPPRSDYERECWVRLSKLPALESLSDQSYAQHVRDLVDQIEEDAATERRVSRRKVLGRRTVLRLPRETRSRLPRPPWFEKRRRLICWAHRLARETVAYLAGYWTFQQRYREASRRFLSGELDAEFPAGSFRPSTFVGKGVRT